MKRPIASISHLMDAGLSTTTLSPNATDSASEMALERALSPPPQCILTQDQILLRPPPVPRKPCHFNYRSGRRRPGTFMPNSTLLETESSDEDDLEIDAEQREPDSHDAGSLGLGLFHNCYYPIEIDQDSFFHLKLDDGKDPLLYCGREGYPDKDDAGWPRLRPRRRLTRHNWPNHSNNDDGFHPSLFLPSLADHGQEDSCLEQQLAREHEQLWTPNRRPSDAISVTTNSCFSLLHDDKLVE